MEKKIESHYYWLDALRFIAAFVVLLSHTRNDYFCDYSSLPAEQQNIYSFVFYVIGRMGHEAVIVFFVLSGFLVGGRTIERIMDKTINLRVYAINRFSRIYPPLTVSIIFFYITTLFVPTEIWNWKTALGNFFNLQGILCDSLVNPFWSLSYEWWFYIVLALLGFSYKSSTNAKRLLGFCLAFMAIGVFVVGEMLIVYLVIWFLGAMAYLIRPVKPNKLILAMSVLGVVLGVALYQISKDTHAFSFPFALNGVLVELFLSLMTCLLIQQVILMKPSSSFTSIIEKSLGYMGNFSYTLYLAHRIISMWIFYFIFEKYQATFTFQNILIFLGIVVASLFGCWLLYFISERHTAVIKRTLAKRFA